MAGASGGSCALPVAAEVHRWPAVHRQADNAVQLLAVADATGVFSPGGFLGVAEEISAGDVVMMPNLPAAQPREEGLCTVGAGAVEAVALLMVDPPHREPGV